MVRELTENEKALLNGDTGLLGQMAMGSNLQEMQKAINAGGGGGLPVASQAEAEAGILNDKTMTPLRVLESINANAPGGGGSAAITTITFDPDIAVSTATNKKTFVEIQTAINAAPGQVWIVVKKAGVLQAANVDAGVHVWDWTKVQRVMSDPDSVNPRLVFPEGSTITLPGAMYLDGVTLEYIGTSGPLATISTINVIVVNYGNLSTGTGAGAEAFRVAPGGLFYIHLQGASSGIFRGDYEVIDSRGTLTVYVWGKTAGAFFGNTDIFRNDPSGSGTVIIDSQVLASGGYTATHANYTDGSDPIPVTVYQRYEERVGELITARNLSAAISSPSNALNTIYNNGSKPRFVTVTVACTNDDANARAMATAQVGSDIVAAFGPSKVSGSGGAFGSGANAAQGTLSFLVPPGSNYRVTDTSSDAGQTVTIIDWFEQDISL